MVLIVALFGAGGCGRNARNGEFTQVEGMIWNTTYHVTFRGDPTLGDSVLRTLHEVGKSLNVFNDSSLVCRVNREIATPVNSDFVRVYNMSVRVNKLSGGAFDPTLGPLITAWGFGRGHTATADTARISDIMRYVGIGRTHLRGDSLLKDDIRTEFNFSAIAKGYGCDRVGEMLRRNGVSDYMVEIGGEVTVAGMSPSGGKWRISVDKPIFQESVLHDSQCIIAVTDMGVATSGNYRNFQRDASGRVFGHTISASTGRPARTDVLSATVLAPTAMEADAMATAFMAMGSASARATTARMGLPVMLVLADSTVWMSEPFDKLLVK